MTRPYRKKAIYLLVFILVLGLAGIAWAQNGEAETQEPPISHQDIQIMINDKLLATDVAPRIEHGRTLVPLRALLEELGAEVFWNAEDQTIEVKQEGLMIKLQVNSFTAYKNGEAIELDVPPRIYHNRTLIPARFISETLGADVGWDNIHRRVNIHISNSFNTNISGSGVVIRDGVVIHDGTTTRTYGTTEYAEEEFVETYDGVDRLKLKNRSGSVSIESWNRDYTEVRALKKSREGEDALDDVEIRVTGGSLLDIETVYLRENIQVSVDYTIMVPRHVEITRVENVNGRISLEDVKGDPDLQNVNGDIQVDDVDGYVSARTSNGAIDISGARGTGDLRNSNGRISAEIKDIKSNISITTTNGAINLTLASSLDADLEARTTNGRISVNNNQVAVDEISSSYLKAEVGSGGRTISLQTTNGSISIN